MKWEYLGAFDQDGVNFHIWSAADESERAVYALTRTSVIPPQRPTVYRSVEEIVAKTGLELVPPPPPKPPPKLPPPPDPNRPHGLFRRPGGWVEVNFIHSVGPLPRGIYEKGGYWPDYALLPTREQYHAAKAAASSGPGT